LAGVTACNGKLDTGETRHSDRANVASGFLYEEVYLELNLNNELVKIGGNTGLTPTTGGAFGSESSRLTTRTNNPTGYLLSVSTDKPNSDINGKSLKHLSLSGHYLPGTSNTCSWVPGSAGAPGSLTNTNNLLGINEWGFTLDPAKLAEQKLCQMPDADHSLRVKQTNTANESGDNTDIYFGAKIDLHQVAGQYQTTVIYTVVGNE
jgi:hypothetical protein